MDSRIEGLAGQIALAELTALKASLKVVLDDPSYSAGDAKKMLLSVLLNSDTVVEGSENDFQAMTPKGFAASVATETRNGIARPATAAENDSGAAGVFFVIASE